MTYAVTMSTTPFSPQEISNAVPHLSPTAQLELKAILFEQRCQQQQVMLNELMPEKQPTPLFPEATANDEGDTDASA